MISESPTRLDVLKPWYVFRSAETGRFVSRWFALRYPNETVKERRLP